MMKAKNVRELRRALRASQRQARLAHAAVIQCFETDKRLNYAIVAVCKDGPGEHVGNLLTFTSDKLNQLRGSAYAATCDRLSRLTTICKFIGIPGVK
jgi:hypothetical protein